MHLVPQQQNFPNGKLEAYPTTIPPRALKDLLAMQLLTPFSLLLSLYINLATSDTVTHYLVDSAQMQSFLFPPYSGTTAGAPAAQDSASKFDLTVQGTNIGALPVLCSLEVQNPGNKLTTATQSQNSSETIPFSCNDTAVSASWTRTNVSSLNGKVTVQLA